MTLLNHVLDDIASAMKDDSNRLAGSLFAIQTGTHGLQENRSAL
ncbi:MAG: hypothetical protein ACFB01_05645 [Cohaesibacteraceae bacterium]